MTKVCVVYGTWTTTANFSYFHLDLNAVVLYLASARIQSQWRTEQIEGVLGIGHLVFSLFRRCITFRNECKLCSR